MGKQLHQNKLGAESQANFNLEVQQEVQHGEESTFYYFAYGSCMCPVDLKRSLGEKTHLYVVGTGTLKGYRLGFYRYSQTRKCGVLDVVPDPKASVKGVLYKLPWRLSEQLDKREDVPRGGYRQEIIEVRAHGKVYKNVRTYVVVNKLATEVAPNDWYFNIVLRGAVTCGLPEEYCWKLFNHMHQLQQQQQGQIMESSLNPPTEHDKGGFKFSCSPLIKGG